MYQSKNEILGGAAITVEASETDTPVTGIIQINDPLNLIVDIVVDSIEDTTAISATLQTAASDGGWTDCKSMDINAVQRKLRVAFATKAATGASDYVVLTDSDGLNWAVAADVSGTDVAPTGAAWVAIPGARKAQADISGQTTAAEVAAVFELAFDALTGFSAVFGTDDTVVSGSLDFSTKPIGNTSTAIATHNTGDTGAGSMTASVVTAGSGAGTYTLKVTQADPDDADYLPLRPKARVVVSTGSSDEVVISEVIVSRQTS